MLSRMSWWSSVTLLIITVSVRLVDISISLLKFYTRGFQDQKAFHCRQQGNYKEKLEMALASPLALFLVSVSQLHAVSPYWPANRRSFAIMRSQDTREEGEENLVSFLPLHLPRLANVR